MPSWFHRIHNRHKAHITVACDAPYCFFLWLTLRKTCRRRSNIVATAVFIAVLFHWMSSSRHNLRQTLLRIWCESVSASNDFLVQVDHQKHLVGNSQSCNRVVIHCQVPLLPLHVSVRSISTWYHHHTPLMHTKHEKSKTRHLVGNSQSCNRVVIHCQVPLLPLHLTVRSISTWYHHHTPLMHTKHEKREKRGANLNAFLNQIMVFFPISKWSDRNTINIVFWILTGRNWRVLSRLFGSGFRRISVLTQ